MWPLSENDFMSREPFPLNKMQLYFTFYFIGHYNANNLLNQKGTEKKNHPKLKQNGT